MNVRRRLASWIILAVMLLAPLVLFAQWAARSTSIDTEREGVTVLYTASRHLVLPGGCAMLRWNVEGVSALTFQDRPVALKGQRKVCPDTSTGYTLAYLPETGAPIRHSLFVRVLFTTPNTRLAGVGYVLYAALAALIVALPGDLPALSPALRLLRRRLKAMLARQAQTITVQLRRAATQRDIIYLTALALLAAIPLILLRYTSWIAPSRVALPVIAIWLAVLARWAYPGFTAERARPARRGAAQPGRWITVSVLLLACAIAGFYRPMQDQFWLGGDEIRVLEDAARGWPSIPLFDKAQGRPLTPLAAIMVGKLTPQSVEGFLWAALALRFLSAALIYGIVRQLLPRYNPLALAAAALYIVNPSEPTRFLAVYMQGYNALTFALLLSLYLYLRAGRAGNRFLLALSCGMLGVGLLIGDPGFAPALIWPALAWLVVERRLRLTWVYAWAITLALFVGRFALYQITTENTYQQSLVLTSFAPKAWLQQLFRQMAAIRRYFAVYDPSLEDWLIGLALGAVVAGALFALARRPATPVALSRRQAAIGLGLALGTMVLGFLPFVTLSGILSTFRTQFLSAPAQAIFLALVIGWLARFFTSQQRGVWLAAMTGLLIALPVASAPNAQAYRPANPAAKYEHTACIAQQVLAQAPAVRPDTLVFFVLDEKLPTPLGWNYYVYNLINYLFGESGYQVGYTDSLGIRYTLDPQEQASGAILLDYSLDQIVAFEITPDGSARLLERLPESILPREPKDNTRYDPHARILPGEPRQPRFLNCPP